MVRSLLASTEGKAIVGVLAVVVGIFSLIALLSATGLGQGLTRQQGSPDLSGDPRLGTTVDTKLGSTPGKETLLILLGECTSCSARHTDYDQIRSLGWPRVIFVFEASLPSIKSHPEHDDAFTVGNVVADVDGQLAGRLNSLWSTRWYVLSADSKLIDLQRDYGELRPKYAEWKARRE